MINNSDNNICTYPQEKRHCTIVRMPSLGPNILLKNGVIERLFLENDFISLFSQERTNKPEGRMFYKKKKAKLNIRTIVWLMNQ